VDSLDVLIERVLDREGGIADVGDGKGITRFGQTPEWLEQFSLSAPKTREEAAVNYRTWIDITGLTSIVAPGDDLADIVLNIAVMSSAPKAVKALQACLLVKVDGVFGGVTKNALADADRAKLARLVIAWDMEYQGRLVTLDPSRAKFAAGWARRMAGHVRNLV
jgi:lysozyme family protein